MKLSRASLRKLHIGLVFSSLWAACALPVLSEGEAARFLGVERWRATATAEIKVQIQGQAKHRKDTHGFALDRHRTQGMKEVWEGTSKVKGTDKDSNLLMWGSVKSEAIFEYRLELDANSDEALLYVHASALKSKAKMGFFGGSGKELPLDQPDQDVVLRTLITDDSDSLVFRQESHEEMIIGRIDSVTTLTFEPDEVAMKAVLAAGSAIRGEKIRLDGSKSKGRIKTFTWTLKPVADSGGHTVSFETKEPHADLVLLADVSVSLTVSDGKKTSPPATDTAKVIPRKWVTSSKPGNEEEDLDTGHLLAPCDPCHFGQSACAICGEADHGIHRAPGVSWNEEGYLLAEASDPGRPFDGVWFVKENRLRLLRKIRLNPDLRPNSPLWELNLGPKKDDFKTLVDSTREHERTHEKFMRRYLDAQDPAPKIESLLRKKLEDVKDQADFEIRTIETLIQEGRFHESEVRAELKKKKQFNRPGTVVLRNGLWNIPNFADKGN